MTDQERLKAMRALGAVWPRGRALPTYPATMTVQQKREADRHYDALSQAFIDQHGKR